MDVTNNGITSVRLARLVLTEIKKWRSPYTINTKSNAGYRLPVIMQGTLRISMRIVCLSENKKEKRYSYSDKTTKSAPRKSAIGKCLITILYHKWGANSGET